MRTIPTAGGYITDEAFWVDGIRYVAPHVAYRMRCEDDEEAPPVTTGHVVRRPMFADYPDHWCPADFCGPESSGRAWRWEPYGSTPQRSSP